jgi:hypothetical protein
VEPAIAIVDVDDLVAVLGPRWRTRPAVRTRDEALRVGLAAQGRLDVEDVDLARQQVAGVLRDKRDPGSVG